MKKMILVSSCLVSITAISQSDMVDVIIDGIPAKLNISTGEYRLTGTNPNNYNTTNSNNKTSNSQGNIHTVNKGETLYSISKEYGVSLSQIKSVNNLNSNLIRVGQDLEIGYSNTNVIQDYNTHTVVKGDTLYSIAKNANISLKQLKVLNNLNTNIITIGQVLKLE